MSLRTKLVIEGDAEGAKKAAQDAQRAMGDTQRRTRDYQRGAMGAARQGGLLAAANDNVATSFRNAAGSIAIIHGPLGGVASRFSAAATLAGRLGVAGGALAVGIGAATFAAQRGVRAFSDYDRQLRTSTALVSATGLAAGRTADDIERLSREIGLGTLAATNEVRQAAGQLLTFRSIAGETFDRTMRAAQDLAAVGFGSVSSSAVQLGKALEDPIQGISALNRSGITFSATQREQIRNFVETGRVAEAQRLILAQVEKQVGGAGLAAAGGLAGAFDSLTEQAGRWFELVGQRTADVIRLRNGLLGLADAIGVMNERMEAVGTVGGRLSLARQELQQLIDMQERAAAPDAFEEQMRGIAGRDPRASAFEDRAQAQRAARIEQLREEIRELERFNRVQQRIERSQAAEGIARARAEQRQGLIDSEIDKLRQEAESLGRSELANLQLQAVRRAGVALDSEAGQQIAELVRHNYELAEAQRQATAAGEDAQRRHEAGRQAVRDLITDLDRELEILRETDPVQREMIRLRDEMAFATSREIDQIREKIGALEEEREAQRAVEAEMAFRRSMVEGVIGDMRRALRDGQLSWETLGDVALNVLDRMIDKMQNEFLDAVFKVNNAGGSGGGFWDILSRLFGGMFGGSSNSGLVPGPFPPPPSSASSAAALPMTASAPPVSSAGAARGMAGDLTLRFDIQNHSQSQVEMGTPRQQGDEIVMPMMIKEIENAMAASVQGNGPLGKAVQHTFNLDRVTR